MEEIYSGQSPQYVGDRSHLTTNYINQIAFIPDPEHSWPELQQEEMKVGIAKQQLKDTISN